MPAQLLDISDEEYFAMPALDQSQLKQFLKNPAEWGYSRLNDDRTPTDAMKFGTAFHAYMLGTAEIVNLPEGETFQKKANKDWRDEQEQAGNIVVSYADRQLLDRMKTNIEQASLMPGNPDYMAIIANGVKEQCITWTDAKTGLDLKAKPDAIPVGTDYLIDLKTSKSAAGRDFHREVISYGYHIQALFYCQAVGKLPADMFDRTETLPTSMQFWVFEKSGVCDWRPWTVSFSKPTKNSGFNNPIIESAALSIRQALTGIAAMQKMGEDAGLGEGLDAAARYAMTHGYEKTPTEVEFTDWDLKDAESLLGLAR